MFDKFSSRHIGVSNEKDLRAMLEVIGVNSVDELIAQVIPASIRLKKPLALPAEGMSEYEFSAHRRGILPFAQIRVDHVALVGIETQVAKTDVAPGNPHLPVFGHGMHLQGDEAVGGHVVDDRRRGHAGIEIRGTSRRIFL